MQVSVSRRYFMRRSELSSLLDVALGRPLEVLRHAGERIDVSGRPFANWLENDGAAFPVDQNRIAVEAKLFGKAHRLASACPEYASDLPLRRRLGHVVATNDSYRRGLVNNG